MMHGQTNIKYITVTHFMLNTQSSVPEDGRNQRPKPVELIGIINKPLLLHLVGVYIIYINDARSNKYQIHHCNTLYVKYRTTRLQRQERVL